MKSAVHLTAAPRPLGPLSYSSLKFDGWDAATPGHVVSCTGLNERQAIDDAAMKLGVPGWRVRVRRSVEPVVGLQSLHLA